MSMNTCKDCIHLTEEQGLDVCLVDHQPVDRPGLGICSFFEPLPVLAPVIDFDFLRGRKHNRIRVHEKADS